MPRTIRDSISGVRARLRAADQPSRAGLVLRYWKMSVYGIYTPQLTTENPTTHTTDQHHVPMDPRAAELMPIHAARLALTRSVTQKAVDPSMGPALRVRIQPPSPLPAARRPPGAARRFLRPASLEGSTCRVSWRMFTRPVWPRGHPSQLTLPSKRRRQVQGPTRHPTSSSSTFRTKLSSASSGSLLSLPLTLSRGPRTSISPEPPQRAERCSSAPRQHGGS